MIHLSINTHQWPVVAVVITNNSSYSIKCDRFQLGQCERGEETNIFEFDPPRPFVGKYVKRRIADQDYLVIASGEAGRFGPIALDAMYSGDFLPSSPTGRVRAEVAVLGRDNSIEFLDSGWISVNSLNPVVAAEPNVSHSSVESELADNSTTFFYHFDEALRLQVRSKLVSPNVTLTDLTDEDIDDESIRVWSPEHPEAGEFFVHLDGSYLHTTGTTSDGIVRFFAGERNGSFDNWPSK
jgi:hypothetical protein